MLTTASMEIVGSESGQFVLLLYYLNSLVSDWITIIVYEDISVVRVTKHNLIMNDLMMKQ